MPEEVSERANNNSRFTKYFRPYMTDNEFRLQWLGNKSPNNIDPFVQKRCNDYYANLLFQKVFKCSSKILVLSEEQMAQAIISYFDQTGGNSFNDLVLGKLIDDYIDYMLNEFRKKHPGYAKTKVDEWDEEVWTKCKRIPKVFANDKTGATRIGMFKKDGNDYYAIKTIHHSVEEDTGTNIIFSVGFSIITYFYWYM